MGASAQMPRPLPFPSTCAGKRQRPSPLLLDLLRALPEAGCHPAALPFVLRALQPLLGAGATELLQAAGLRLLCRLWQSSGGRAYPQLRTAVIGYAAPGQKPGLALRVARAECLRDIADADPDKGAELAGLVQVGWGWERRLGGCGGCGGRQAVIQHR